MKKRIVLSHNIPTPLELIRRQAMEAPSYTEARLSVENLYIYCLGTGDAEVLGWIDEIRAHHHYKPPISLMVANENNLPPRRPQNAPMVTGFFRAVNNQALAGIVISRLHQLMDGKSKPKDVLMPVRAAMDAGVIRRPTWEEFRKEFPDAVKQKSSLSNYTNPTVKPYDDEAFRSTVDTFRRLMSEE